MNEQVPTDAPRAAFRSARLLAEPVVRGDAPAMARALADARIHRYLNGGPPSEADLARRYAFLEGGRSPDGTERWLTWILRLEGPNLTATAATAATAATDATTATSTSATAVGPSGPIGFVQATIEPGARCSVAYVLNPAFWGRGLAREAISAMLDHVFAHHDAPLAVAEMQTTNSASIALARALGFELTDTVDLEPSSASAMSPHEPPLREHVFVLTRDAWAARPLAANSAAAPRSET